ncbi:hypothetical protein ACHAPJ_013591, partial [Fusarium lateritium]
ATFIYFHLNNKQVQGLHCEVSNPGATVKHCDYKEYSFFLFRHFFAAAEYTLRIVHSYDPGTSGYFPAGPGGFVPVPTKCEDNGEGSVCKQSQDATVQLR